MSVYAQNGGDEDPKAVELLQESLAELQQEEEYDPSEVHIFVVMGASVS